MMNIFKKMKEKREIKLKIEFWTEQLVKTEMHIHDFESGQLPVGPKPGCHVYYATQEAWDRDYASAIRYRKEVCNFIAYDKERLERLERN